MLMCSAVQFKETSHCKYQVEPYEVAIFAGQNSCLSPISCHSIICEFLVISQDSQVIPVVCECAHIFYLLLATGSKQCFIFAVYDECLLKFFVV